MPPRWLCLLIVLCWLACNGWLFWRDLRPRFLSGQAPPYSIDLVDEHTNRRPKIKWSIYQGNRKVLNATTNIEYNAKDADFELTAEYKSLVFNQPTPVPTEPPLLLHALRSRFRINPAGDLIEFVVDFQEEPALELPQGLPRFEASLSGLVEAESVKPELEINLLGRTDKRTLAGIEIPRGGVLLLPLHPLKRWRGLRPGQAWNMVLLDPLTDALHALLGVGSGPRHLRARVRDQVEELSGGRYHHVPCLVIDYEAEHFEGSTWVRQADGMVLCQEATVGKTLWTMYRDH
jgi:hypothetical protein